MTLLATRRGRSSSFAPILLALASFGLSGCYDDDGTYTCYPDDPYSTCYDDNGAYSTCKTGVTQGTLDTGAILDLDPGNGVGATVEYAGDGAWRFAVTCDSLLTGYLCDWTLLVSSIDGTIDSFEPEGLEEGDLVERYSTMEGSTTEDSVIFYSYTDVSIDAFTVVATPGAAMSVAPTIDGNCAGSYLFWTEDGAAKSSSTPSTELYPNPEGS